MPRAKIWGYVAVILSAALFGAFVYAVFFLNFTEKLYLQTDDLSLLPSLSYYGVAVPAGLVALFVICTGFWIGWTIITIKVVPPMPEIVDKKDNSKIKAVLLCVVTAFLGFALVYGIYVKSYWAIAIPSAVITLVILGAIFWVGIAIITTRSTLEHRK